MNGTDCIIGATNNTSIKNIISSQPVRICYCNGRNVSCNNKRKILDVKKGETFKVAVAALDQASHMVDAPVFITSMQKYVYHQEMVQQVQMTKKECSNITLKASSPNDSVELTIHANSPCKDDEISEAITLHINFKNCTCPIGFQPQLQEVCVCDCDQQIKPFINTCNPSSMSLLRQGDFWIDYFNNTQYLIYPHCPYDYCLPSTHDINISLNIPNGADDQCALNRTGLLCSSCKSGLSLSLGTSQCLPCPKHWPKLLFIIMFDTMVSGIVLVSTILVLNLTVATGTLNGLIFYANIVASNNITYNNTSKPNVFSVFIAWLNLELGIKICAFTMDWTHT